MTPEQLAIVHATFDKASASLDRLAVLFYENLFALAPEVRPLFPDDLTAQRVKLADQLTAIIAAIDRLDQLVALTGPLGVRHAEYKVEAHHYEFVGEALIDAIAEVVGDDWDADAYDAWAHAYDLVAETMMQAAAGRGRA